VGRSEVRDVKSESLHGVCVMARLQAQTLAAPPPAQQFNDIGQAKGSRLVRRLLKIEQVSSVFLGRDFISINKREEAAWAALRPVILDSIMDAYAELEAKGTPLVEHVEASPDTEILPEDDEVTAMIKELLDTRIRPAVQEDGGDIFYK